MTLRCRVRIDRPSFRLDVDVRVDEPAFVALFGPSGSGKTTLLRCVAGLERAQDADIRLGDAVWQLGKRFVPTHRRSLGYVFQESSLFPHLDVEGNLRFGSKPSSVTQPAKPRLALAQVAELMGIGHMLKRSPTTLSGGERQRVAIARALLRDPDILLFDEPMASLDLASRSQLLPYLGALHRELAIPILYVTHAPDEVVRLADRVVCLERGSVVAEGPLNAILTQPDLPLSRFENAGGVVEAVVLAHEPQFHLTTLALGDARFSVSQRAASVGARVRIHIRARDVALSTDATQHTSAQNVVAARVLSIHEESDPSHRLVRLAVGESVILARVTHKSVEQLGLREGSATFAHVKSVALTD